jgi:excisionase family DNA binding protein
MDGRELYSIEDARFLLDGISRMTIYQLLNDGELASVLIGRRRFIPAAAIIAFIAAISTHPAPAERRRRGRPRTVQMSLALQAPPPARGRRRSAAQS